MMLINPCIKTVLDFGSVFTVLWRWLDYTRNKNILKTNSKLILFYFTRVA